MQNNADLALYQLIIEINELLNEIKIEQTNLSNKMEHNHKVNMQKFSKLLDFCEIEDMANKLFEKRISNIEKEIKSIKQQKEVN